MYSHRLRASRGRGKGVKDLAVLLPPCYSVVMMVAARVLHACSLVLLHAIGYSYPSDGDNSEVRAAILVKRQMYIPAGAAASPKLALDPWRAKLGRLHSS